MELGVKLRPAKTKGEHDPGHMGVYWQKDDDREFRGFRFYVDDLPDEYQDPAKWRDYLFNNRVPGYIFDDIILRDDYQHRKEKLLECNWALEDEQEPLLRKETKPRQFTIALRGQRTP